MIAMLLNHQRIYAVFRLICVEDIRMRIVFYFEETYVGNV